MTQHKIVTADSSNIDFIDDKSINLIVTSPPYPMIQMWDDMFSVQDSSIGIDIANNRGSAAFTKMHNILNKVWIECDRVLTDHGFICINIGDATRTIGDDFQLYSNHSKIIEFFSSAGYHMLPDILWKKPSNAPNKFMGSGMLPAGAYVTYEHEYILIFRKGGKKNFNNKDRERRQKSAYFWEERNIWFSDLWEVKGTSQVLKSPTRSRNASFPFEIPYRLINMYSIQDDTILDPFCGLGTTNLACMASHRNSIGIEIDSDITDLALKRLSQTPIKDLNKITKERFSAHEEFINSLPNEKRNKCYKNINYNFLVKTKQETNILIPVIEDIVQEESVVICR